MADLTFNTNANETVAREFLILYLNTGTQQAPTWSPLGKRVEDSSIEYDWQKENRTDILGNSYALLKKPQMTQSFSAYPLDSADTAAVQIWNKAIKDHDIAALAAMDVLLVHLYAGTAKTAMFAERYEASTITPTSLGGEGGGDLNSEMEVDFGGVRTTGTAAIAQGVVTFTADAA